MATSIKTAPDSDPALSLAHRLGVPLVEFRTANTTIAGSSIIPGITSVEKLDRAIRSMGPELVAGAAGNKQRKR